jgi:hypothetical protein
VAISKSEIVEDAFGYVVYRWLVPKKGGLAAIALNPGIIDTEMLEVSFGRASADFPGPAIGDPRQ